MRGMYTGVSGLQAHQVMMDVIGNNIANVDTIGFKASRTKFADVFSQSLGTSHASGGTSGAPIQVGLGVTLAGTELMQTQGNLQYTGRDLDVAIQGEGFLVMKGDDGGLLFTRAGSLATDANGYLYNQGAGLHIQGWMPNAGGTWGALDQTQMADIQLPLGTSTVATPTSKVNFMQNLDADRPISTTTPPTGVTIPSPCYDSLGKEHTISFTFARTGTNQWSVSAVDEKNTALTATAASVTFNTDGTMKTPADGLLSFTYTPPGAAAAANQAITVDMSKVTQASNGGSGSTMVLQNQNGSASGALESIKVDSDGTVWGAFTNGTRKQVARVALATFANTAGLSREGGTFFARTGASGPEQLGPPQTGNRGSLSAGNVETSNVDLATEFTNMITAQRGFQANSKVITTSDEMMQELVNLRR